MGCVEDAEDPIQCIKQEQDVVENGALSQPDGIRNKPKIADMDPAEQPNALVNNAGRPSMTKDNIKIEDVYTALGGYSWFQLWVTIVMLLPEIPAAMIAIAPVFTSVNNVRFVCYSEVEGNHVNSEGEIAQKIMLASDANLCSSNCSSIFAANDEMYYGSIVQEWNLVCERAWLTDTFTSIQMAGMMTGSFLGSIIADKYGRKKCFYITSLMMAIFGTASGLAIDIYTFGVTKYLAGIGVGGFYVVFNIYLIEFLTPNWRTIAGCVSIWCFGEMLLALLAYNIYSWRILTIVSSIPAVLIFITYPFMPESPRWLLCQNRTKEATKTFKQIARWNFKKSIDSSTISKLQTSISAEKKYDDESIGQAFPIMSILTNRKLCLPLVLFLFGWFSCALVYYGITFNMKSLSGSPYLNVFLLGLVDLPAFPSGALFSNCIGRKKTYSSCLIVASVFLAAIVIVELTVGISSYPTLITVLCFLGRFGISGAWGIVGCFTAEAFPTVVRTTCLGLCALASNIGGILSPQLAYLATLSEALPYFVFCGLTVISAILSWFLEETYGQPLQNFVH